MKEGKKPYLCPTAVVYTMAVEGGLLSGSNVIPGGGAGEGEHNPEILHAPGFGGYDESDNRSSGSGSGDDIWSDVEEY